MAPTVGQVRENRLRWSEGVCVKEGRDGGSESDKRNGDGR